MFERFHGGIATDQSPSSRFFADSDHGPINQGNFGYQIPAQSTVNQSTGHSGLRKSLFDESRIT